MSPRLTLIGSPQEPAAISALPSSSRACAGCFEFNDPTSIGTCQLRGARVLPSPVGAGAMTKRALPSQPAFRSAVATGLGCYQRHAVLFGKGRSDALDRLAGGGFQRLPQIGGS